MSMFLNRPRQFSLALSALFLFAGCNPDGILYDFKSYQNFQAGKVHNAPAELSASSEEDKRNGPSLEFFALGCAGSGNEGQRIVAQSMAQAAGNSKIDFVLYLGDNFYGRGVSSVTDPQWQTKFEAIYTQQSLQIPFYAVLGNHDHYRNPDAQVAYSETNVRWRMPARYYSFERTLADGTQIEFFGLDTELILKGKGGDQVRWLSEKLQASKARWKIVYGHHPVHSGAFTYRKQIEKMSSILEPLFIRYGADLYISAHNHSIEVLKEINGVHYIVSGGGSRPRDVEWTDQTNFAYADLGFVWLGIDRDVLEIRVAGKEGEILFQSEILKS